ncbi:hypothetical protein [Geothrix sp. PMB-07]|uniref:hypothetical protein n=1 Tax=Geothrix sp. PMB-07 TaxID=3068640 RepID=UPI00274234A9|nr:hypothetical protein [Geothrix sp. PMB-07]WLT33230.1 hypothetical protein Q9293_07820 [Geothrix sp. PMB-07]
MLRSFSFLTLAPALAFAALTIACGTPETTVPPNTAAKNTEPFTPVLSLRPRAISLSVGATQVFQAEINYPEGVRYLRQPVKWEVVEVGGGTISGSGLYTAPTAAGVYHVKVTREDFPEVTATATVTVK